MQKITKKLEKTFTLYYVFKISYQAIIFLLSVHFAPKIKLRKKFNDN